MSRRRWTSLVVALLALLVTAPAGLAAEAEEPAAPRTATAKQIAALLDGDRQTYVGPGFTPRIDQDRLREEAARNPGVRYVLLGRPIPNGRNAQRAAMRIVRLMRTPATVVVILNGALNAASDDPEVSREDIRAAVEEARPQARTEPLTALATFTGAVGGGGGDGGGRPIWQWLLLAAVIALVALLLLRLRATRTSTTRQRRRGGSIGTAQDFHHGRLDALAQLQSSLVGPAAERGDDPDVQTHFETASGKLLALRRTLPTLGSPRELRTCAAELDEIQWHLECVEAGVRDEAPPPRPSRDGVGLCFFTHEHGLARETVDLVKPDGTVAAVGVCPANAEALRNGEMPIVSTVHVGSREIPWPAAPTWYGASGWTLDDLPGLEYAGREIWGRDMPRREPPPPPRGALRPGASSAAATAVHAPRDAAQPFDGPGVAHDDVTGEADALADADADPARSGTRPPDGVAVDGTGLGLPSDGEAPDVPAAGPDAAPGDADGPMPAIADPPDPRFFEELDGPAGATAPGPDGGDEPSVEARPSTGGGPAGGRPGDPDATHLWDPFADDDDIPPWERDRVDRPR